MLDYPSSRSRKWAGMGALVILSVPVLILNLAELQVRGDLTMRTRTMQLSGTNQHPVLIFEAREGSVSCKVDRCRYPNWRRDVGALVDVGVDEDGRVSKITVQGVTRLSPEDLESRRTKGLIGAMLLLMTGIALCVQAWRVKTRS